MPPISEMERLLQSQKTLQSYDRNDDDCCKASAAGWESPKDGDKGSWEQTHLPH